MLSPSCSLACPPSGAAGPFAGSAAPSPAVSPRFKLSRCIHLLLVTILGGKVVFLLLGTMGNGAALRQGLPRGFPAHGAERFHQMLGVN